jgi:hypothetical protein
MRHRTVLCTLFVLCTAAVAAPAVEQLVVLTSGHDSDHPWSAQQVVGDDATNTCGNPCPVLDKSTGRLLLRLTHPTDPDTTCKFDARIRPMVNDCQVAELFDGGGTLLITLRSTHGRNVHAQATARAGGATSSAITAADGLGDPLWPASLIRHETKPGAHPRIQLTVKTRADAGRTSRELPVLVPGMSAYSNLVSQAPDTGGCRDVNGEKRA